MEKSPLSEEEILRIQHMITLYENRQFYDLLGIPTDASSDAIREAYFERSREWHPDRFFRKELGSYSSAIEQIFIRLTEAHNILSERSTRRAYDREHQITSVATSARIRRESSFNHRKGRRRKEFEQRRQTNRCKATCMRRLRTAAEGRRRRSRWQER